MKLFRNLEVLLLSWPTQVRHMPRNTWRASSSCDLSNPARWRYLRKRSITALGFFLPHRHWWNQIWIENHPFMGFTNSKITGRWDQLIKWRNENLNPIWTWYCTDPGSYQNHQTSNCSIHNILSLCRCLIIYRVRPCPCHKSIKNKLNRIIQSWIMNNESWIMNHYHDYQSINQSINQSNSNQIKIIYQYQYQHQSSIYIRSDS